MTRFDYVAAAILTAVILGAFVGVGAKIAYSSVEDQCTEKGRAVLTQTTSINCEVKKWTP